MSKVAFQSCSNTLEICELDFIFNLLTFELMKLCYSCFHTTSKPSIQFTLEFPHYTTRSLLPTKFLFCTTPDCHQFAHYTYASHFTAMKFPSRDAYTCFTSNMQYSATAPNLLGLDRSYLEVNSSSGY